MPGVEKERSMQLDAVDVVVAGMVIAFAMPLLLIALYL